MHTTARYRTSAIAARLAIASAILGLVVPVWAGDVAPAAPEKAAAPATEAALTELLKTDMGPPYPMAAIKFGPEFWTALEADAPGEAQDTFFRKLFSGGLLFGIGRLDNVLATARGGEQAVVRWAAPPTMKAALVLEIEQPNVQVSVEGQLVPLRAEAPGADPNSLLNQLQFVFFPLRTAGGQAVLADMARSMTLVLTGLAPRAVQRFTWEIAPRQQQQRAPFPWNQGPIVVQGPQPRQPGQLRNQFGAARAERAAGMAGPAEAMGMAPGGMGGGGMAGGLGGAAPAAPGPALPIEGAVVPLEVEPPAQADAAAPPLLYPLSRAASNVGAPPTPQNMAFQEAPALSEAYVTIDQVSRADGTVTVSYLTSPQGQQEVEMVDEEGRTVQRIAGGPAPANGEALASWKPPVTKAGVEEAPLSVVLRNTVETPLGTQLSEALAPLPTDAKASEPEGAFAPPPPTVADLSVDEISVLGDLLQVRAHVAPVTSPQGLTIPPVSITITDEAGNPVKTLAPTPPAPGKDYVFAWDATDQGGKPVPDGRYVLRVAARMDSARGRARSELRYWVEVPVERMRERLAALGPTAVETLQAELAEQKPGLVLLAYFAPQAGRLKAFVVDGLGRVVRHLVDDDILKGAQKLIWDGKDDAGQPLPDAPYTVNFELDAGEQGAWWGAVALDELTAVNSEE